MRTNGSQDRPQTIKQAKAAFKARGPTAVSAAERRRLERGAQLLERASRIKEQEQRKKEVLKKKEVKEPKEQPQKPAVLLGTQRRLDKFGYKSSQFHLGAFLKAACPPVVAEKKQVLPEPWDDEDVDDDTLLDIVSESPQTSHVKAEQVRGEDAILPVPAQEGNTTSSPSTEKDFGQWDDILESSAQLAREISGERVVLPKQPALTFSSFGSADFDFSEEDFEKLEQQAASQTSSGSRVMPRPQNLTFNDSAVQRSSVGMVMPPPQKRAFGDAEDRQRMPPPPPKHKRSPQTSHRKRATTRTINDISLAELESLAEEDIELSQFPAG